MIEREITVDNLGFSAAAFAKRTLKNVPALFNGNRALTIIP